MLWNLDPLYYWGNDHLDQILNYGSAVLAHSTYLSKDTQAKSIYSWWRHVQEAWNERARLQSTLERHSSEWNRHKNQKFNVFWNNLRPFEAFQ